MSHTPTPTTRFRRDKPIGAGHPTDDKRLIWLQTVWLKQPCAAVSARTNKITVAFNHAGIRDLQDLIQVGENGIDSLEYLDPTGLYVIQLELANKARLRAALSFYHVLSRENKGPFDISRVRFPEFSSYRVSTYDPTTTIVHWKSPNREVREWTKIAKPLKSDYRVYKDATMWVLAREQIETTLGAHGLSHMIDITHVPQDKELYEMQSNFLCNVFSHIMQESVASPHC